MGSKKIIRVTESDISEMVKRVLVEAGGYDDPGVMAIHGGVTQSHLKKMVMDIANIIDSARTAFEEDLDKLDIMNGITRVTDLLQKIKHTLSDITGEIMNDDVKRAAKNFYRSVKTAESKLRMLSNQSQSFQRPGMPQALGGVGFSMKKEDFNDKFTEILMDLGNHADKLSFQINDEDDKMVNRLSHFNSGN